MPPNALFHGNIMAMLFYSSPLMRIADFIQWRFFTLLTGSTGVSTSDYFMPLPYYCHEIAMHNRPLCVPSSAYLTHANTARIAPAPRSAINPCRIHDQISPFKAARRGGISWIFVLCPKFRPLESWLRPTKPMDIGLARGYSI